MMEFLMMAFTLLSVVYFGVMAIGTFIYFIGSLTDCDITPAVKFVAAVCVILFIAMYVNVILLLIASVGVA